MFFKENLKILMKRYKITGERLAEKLELSNGAVSAYITGVSDPPMKTILKIAKILNTSLDTLFYTDLSKLKYSVKEESSVWQETTLSIAKEPSIEYESEKNTADGCMMSGGCIIRRVAVMEEQLLKLKNK